MSLSKRDFLQVLGAASVAGFGMGRVGAAQAASAYDLPRFGNVSLLHLTDCHAQLLPSYFREPSVNLGFGPQRGQWPHRVGDALLTSAGIRPHSREAHAFTHLDYLQGAQIAFSPGFRWGTSLLPGQAITRELLMDQTAITYPHTTVSNMTGQTVRTVLEDVADNLFNPNPCYQQGGDRVRTGGLSDTCEPGAATGARISDMRLNGVPLEAEKLYKAAGWALVAEEAKSAGSAPIWDLVEGWLKAGASGGKPARVKAQKVNTPTLVGAQGNPGMARWGGRSRVASMHAFRADTLRRTGQKYSYRDGCRTASRVHSRSLRSARVEARVRNPEAGLSE